MFVIIVHIYMMFIYISFINKNWYKWNKVIIHWNASDLILLFKIQFILLYRNIFCSLSRLCHGFKKNDISSFDPLISHLYTLQLKRMNLNIYINYFSFWILCIKYVLFEFLHALNKKIHSIVIRVDCRKRNKICWKTNK